MSVAGLLLLAVLATPEGARATQPLPCPPGQDCPPPLPALDLAHRRDAAVVVLTPPGATPRTSAARLLEAAARAFAEDTDLRLLPGPQLGLDPAALRACPAERRLGCWAELGRTAQLELLLIVSLVAGAGADRAAMSLLDPAAAAGKSESEIFTAIADVPPRPLLDADALMREALEAELRPYLAARGRYRPFGEVLLSSSCVGCELLLGERALPLSDRTVRLGGLRPGALSLGLSRGGEVVCRAEVVVVAGQTAALRCDPAPGVERHALLYGGLGALALGVAGVVGSRALLADTPQVCLAAEEADCPYVQSARSGFGAERPLPAREVNRGVPLWPLGLGLIAAGGAWSGGSMLLDDLPWWGVALGGLALGGGTAAMAAALE